MKRKVLIVGLLSIFLFAGCVSSGVKNFSTGVDNIKIDKSTKTIDKTVVIYADSLDKSSISRPACNRQIKEIYDYLSKNKVVENELRARDVAITYLSKKPKYLTKVILTAFKSNDVRNSCKPEAIKVDVLIEDISKLSSSWSEKVDGKTIHSLFKDQENKKVIWEGVVTLVLNDKTQLSDFSRLLMEELDKTNIFPKKTKSLEEVKQMEIIKAIQSCKKNSDSLTLTYNSTLNTLCIGKAGFSNIKNSFKKTNKDMVLPLSTEIQEFVSSNKVCPVIKYMGIDGKKIENKAVNFKQTYLEQIQVKYNNTCRVSKVDDLNFLICKDENKNDFFIEKSEKDGDRIFSKKLLQVDKECFNRFKEFTQTKKQDILDQPLTANTNYHEALYNLDIFKTESKEKIFNYSFYNGSTHIEKVEKKLYLVANKYYGDKSKPTKFEKYYFFLEDEKKFNLKNGKYTFAYKKVRNFDKDGYDKNGYDIDGYDKEGYNSLGYDRGGFNKEGYNKYGMKKNSQKR